MQRRRVLRGLVAVTGSVGMAGILDGVAPLSSPAHAADELPRTPSQAEGPYYPGVKPADADWNLLRVGADGSLPAGEPLDLHGRILDPSGQPVADATVEIWQVDGGGIYDHPRADDRDRFDRRFQGYGAAMTDPDGRYAFLSLVPVPYPGRPPHIHVKITRGSEEVLTTQLYIKDHPENDRDGLLAYVLFRNQDELLMDLHPAELPGGITGQAARFDFVI